jgi:hypothetical protein
MEREQTASLSVEEMREIAQAHNSNLAIVKKILEAGINPQDVETLLEMRDHLSGVWYTDEEGLPGPKREDIASVESLISAYQAVEGNLDDLQNLVEVAKSSTDSSRPRWGEHTRALLETVEEYQKIGDLIFERL